jgi:hypothetical protein
MFRLLKRGFAFSVLLSGLFSSTLADCVRTAVVTQRGDMDRAR